MVLRLVLWGDLLFSEERVMTGDIADPPEVVVDGVIGGNDGAETVSFPVDFGDSIVTFLDLFLRGKIE